MFPWLSAEMLTSTVGSWFLNQPLGKQKLVLSRSRGVWEIKGKISVLDWLKGKHISFKISGGSGEKLIRFEKSRLHCISNLIFPFLTSISQLDYYIHLAVKGPRQDKFRNVTWPKKWQQHTMKSWWLASFLTELRLRCQVTLSLIKHQHGSFKNSD